MVIDTQPFMSFIQENDKSTSICLVFYFIIFLSAVS